MHLGTAIEALLNYRKYLYVKMKVFKLKMVNRTFFFFSFLSLVNDIQKRLLQIRELPIGFSCGHFCHAAALLLQSPSSFHM